MELFVIALPLCVLFFLNSIHAFFFFSSRRRHTRSDRDWSSDVCSSDLKQRDDAHPHRDAHVVPKQIDHPHGTYCGKRNGQSYNRGLRDRPSIEVQEQENRSEEHTSELQSRSDLVCRLLLEKKKKN